MIDENFMMPDINSLRTQVKGIDESYKNPWDLFAELSQNAVDAIRKKQQEDNDLNRELTKGKIEIEVNSIEKSVKIKDNGCGISKSDLPKYLRPFTSGKRNDPNSVGEKGVGLKFVYFLSNYFELKTFDGEDGSYAKITDANIWKKSNDDSKLKLDYGVSNKNDYGTEIYVKGIEFSNDDDTDGNLSIFKLTFEQLVFILRTKTYIGPTDFIWNNDCNDIEIFLKYLDSNNQEHSGEITNKYWLPTEGLANGDIQDIDEFESWISNGDKSDQQKRRKLQDKILVKKGVYLHRDYRRICFYACFLPNRGYWKQINKRIKLLSTDNEENDDWINEHSFCLFSSGILTSTKGMPTGISIDSPNTGNAGYWPNFFMIFQDDALKFDIGRKSINGSIQKIYQEKAKEIFNQITKYVIKYTSSTTSTINSNDSFDLVSITNDVNNLVPLLSNNVVFEKNPKDQEASVSAIFYELIGNGLISDIKPIYTGYRNKYDLYANFIKDDGSKKFGIYEFKSKLRNILNDFDETVKIFTQMDYIICWEVTDEDIQKLHDKGIECQEIEDSLLQERNFPKSVTHSITMPNCNPVYVIDIKKIV